MRNILATAALLLCLCAGAGAEEYSWKAKWISKEQQVSETNSWMAFRKDVEIEKVPSSLVARIAADTKYWLWINGEPVVFEGGLKRGPSIGGGYYDKVEIAPFLKQGKNRISVLVWYFGRSGFSHMSSGTLALLFDAQCPGIEILTDKSWEASVQHGYGTASHRKPNIRLSESNIRYDANAYNYFWFKEDNPKWLGSALELPFKPGDAPLGELVERPIPLWKDYGLKEYPSTRQSGDTLYCKLPYNCQFTPWLKVEAPKGKVISIHTDHDIVTGEKCISAEYVTKDGVQEYESFGWMSGEEVFYIIPSDVKVLDVKFRETGYNSEFTGTFSCSDPFLNDYWQKAQRTLYICMRDTYYDCPDRERAQWWGDEVNELNEAFYLLDRKADNLARKGIMELVRWQKPDGVMYAPIPCSNYFKELPMQILNSIGWYGFRGYGFYSGDFSFVKDVYPALKKVFAKRYNATTYMFPYVLDALYTMGEPQMALDRMRKMYPTIMKDSCSTLYEHWNFDGSCNHAWAGGGVISMVRQLAGIDALEPGYKSFSLKPHMGDLKWLKTGFETNYGRIEVSLEKKGRRIDATVTVPEGTTCKAGGRILVPGTHKVRL